MTGRWQLLLAALLAQCVQLAAQQQQTIAELIYDEELGEGWEDRSWKAQRDGGAHLGAASGDNCYDVTLEEQGALALYRAAGPFVGVEGVAFWVRGSGARQLVVRLLDDAYQGPWPGVPLTQQEQLQQADDEDVWVQVALPWTQEVDDEASAPTAWRFFTLHAPSASSAAFQVDAIQLLFDWQAAQPALDQGALLLLPSTTAATPPPAAPAFDGGAAGGPHSIGHLGERDEAVATLCTTFEVATCFAQAPGSPAPAALQLDGAAAEAGFFPQGPLFLFSEPNCYGQPSALPCQASPAFGCGACYLHGLAAGPKQQDVELQLALLGLPQCPPCVCDYLIQSDDSELGSSAAAMSPQACVQGLPGGHPDNVVGNWKLESVDDGASSGEDDGGDAVGAWHATGRGGSALAVDEASSDFVHGGFRARKLRTSKEEADMPQGIYQVLAVSPQEQAAVAAWQVEAWVYLKSEGTVRLSAMGRHVAETNQVGEWVQLGGVVSAGSAGFSTRAVAVRSYSPDHLFYVDDVSVLPAPARCDARYLEEHLQVQYSAVWTPEPEDTTGPVETVVNPPYTSMALSLRLRNDGPEPIALAGLVLPFDMPLEVETPGGASVLGPGASLVAAAATRTADPSEMRVNCFWATMRADPLLVNACEYAEIQLQPLGFTIRFTAEAPDLCAGCVFGPANAGQVTSSAAQAWFSIHHQFFRTLARRVVSAAPPYCAPAWLGAQASSSEALPVDGGYFHAQQQLLAARLGDDEDDGCQTFEVDEPLAIGDDGEAVISSLVVPAHKAMPLASLAVSVRLSHSKLKALRLKLRAESPLGGDKVREVQLATQQGGLASQLQDATFSDTGVAPLPSGASAKFYEPFQSNWRPFEPFTKLLDGGMHRMKAPLGGSFGKWSLVVRDVGVTSEKRQGVLEGWSIKMCPAKVPTSAQTADGLHCSDHKVNGPLYAQLDEESATRSIVSAINVPNAFTVERASLALDVDGAWMQKVNLTLEALDPFSDKRREALLMHKQGGAASSLVGTVFDDGADSMIFPGADGVQQSPFTGAWHPYTPLATLVEGDSRVAGTGGSSGVWRLTVTDWGPGVEERELVLDKWTLTLCEAMNPDPCGLLEEDTMSLVSSTELQTPDKAPVNSAMGIRLQLENTGDVAVALGTLRYFIEFSGTVKEPNTGMWAPAIPSDFYVRCTNGEILDQEQQTVGNACDVMRMHVAPGWLVVTFADTASICAGCTMRGFDGEPLFSVRHKGLVQLQQSTTDTQTSCEAPAPTPAPAPALSPEQAAKQDCLQLSPLLTVTGFPDAAEVAQTDGVLHQFADFGLVVQNPLDYDVSLTDLLIPIRFSPRAYVPWTNQWLENQNDKFLFECRHTVITSPAGQTGGSICPFMQFSIQDEFIELTFTDGVLCAGCVLASPGGQGAGIPVMFTVHHEDWLTLDLEDIEPLRVQCNGDGSFAFAPAPAPVPLPPGAPSPANAPTPSPATQISTMCEGLDVAVTISSEESQGNTQLLYHMDLKNSQDYEIELRHVKIPFFFSHATVLTTGEFALQPAATFATNCWFANMRGPNFWEPADICDDMVLTITSYGLQLSFDNSNMKICSGCSVGTFEEFDFQTGVGNNPATTFSVSNVLNNPFLVQTSGVGAAECTPWDTSMDTTGVADCVSDSRNLQVELDCAGFPSVQEASFLGTQANVQVECSLEIKNTASHDVTLAGLSVPVSFSRKLADGAIGATDDFVAVCNYLYTPGAASNVCDNLDVEVVAAGLLIKFDAGAPRLCPGCRLSSEPGTSFFVMQKGAKPMDLGVLPSAGLPVCSTVLGDASVSLLPSNADDCAIPVFDVYYQSFMDITVGSPTGVPQQNNALAVYVDIANKGNLALKLKGVRMVVHVGYATVEATGPNKGQYSIANPADFELVCNWAAITKTNGAVGSNACSYVTLSATNEGITIEFSNQAPNLCPGCSFSAQQGEHALIQTDPWIQVVHKQGLAFAAGAPLNGLKAEAPHSVSNLPNNACDLAPAPPAVDWPEWVFDPEPQAVVTEVALEAQVDGECPFVSALEVEQASAWAQGWNGVEAQVIAVAVGLANKGPLPTPLSMLQLHLPLAGGRLQVQQEGGGWETVEQPEEELVAACAAPHDDGQESESGAGAAASACTAALVRLTAAGLTLQYREGGLCPGCVLGSSPGGGGGGGGGASPEPLLTLRHRQWRPLRVVPSLELHVRCPQQAPAPSPAPFACSGGDCPLVVLQAAQEPLYQAGVGLLRMALRLSNVGPSAVPLPLVELRYWMHGAGGDAATLYSARCTQSDSGDESSPGCDAVALSVEAGNPKLGQRYVVRVRFDDGAGLLEPGATTQVLSLQVERESAPLIDQMDFSFAGDYDPTLRPNARIAASLQGVLQWGEDPL